MNTSLSQGLSDFEEIDYLELNSSELELLLRKANSRGYNVSDLIEIAKTQGYSEDKIEELKSRLESAEELRRVASNASYPVENSRLRKKYNEEVKIIREKTSNVFGYDIFKGNGFLTFQSNYNMPTPTDYILGPGDNLYIDIYGESESYFNGEISPDGFLIIENIGPVNLNGLTVKKAEQKLISKLSPVYSGILSKKTSLNLSLGTPRSISVNIIGEVNLPGTYTFSALNSVFNALYVAGGITENATLRKIKLYRDNKLIETIDLYKYLNSGDSSSNLRLKNNDLILVDTYTNRVEVKGNIKKPGIYEVKNSENLLDLINYFGGFQEKAYKKTIKLTRIIDDQLMIVDIDEADYGSFKPKSGDVYLISQVLEKYSNRIIIQGAINRPGEYSLSNGMSVKNLIKKSGGLKPDVFFEMATIKRTNNDYSTELISFNLQELLNNNIQDINLIKEDILTIFSINDLGEEKFIKITGEVNKPGIFQYSENTYLNELILLSGGLTDNANRNRIEISRIINSNEPNSNDMTEILLYDIDKKSKFKIKPFDEITVRKKPNLYTQKYINIEGEVNYPGKYAISSKNERISDIIRRAGGFKNLAYLKGATLFRLTESFQMKSEIEKKMQDLEDLKQSINEKNKIYSEGEILLIERIDEDLINLKKQLENNLELSNSAKTNRINEIAKKNSIESYLSSSKYESIGIDLESVINFSGSKSDLLLKEGDVIVVPKKLETVKLRGELLYPNTVRFSSNKSFKYYINGAGGFDSKAKKSGSYVVYANGDVARTKKLLFFNIYPKIEPGAEIIVPKKSLKNPLGVSQLLNYTTGLATLILAISQIN